MHIEQVLQASEELHEALRQLIPQLGSHKAAPTPEALDRLVRSEASRLVIAREPDASGPIVGILCLIIYRVPTGLRSIVEDVIVDERMRRRGVGAALIQRAITLAREAGAEGVSLTSNPSRAAANRLYQSLGFELRRTNPYFYRFK